MLTILVFLLPLLAGGLFLSLQNEKLQSSLTMVFGIAQIVLIGFLSNTFSQNLPLLDFDKSWISGFNIRFHLGLDSLSLIFVCLSMAVCTLILWAVNTLNYDRKGLLFALICFTEAALVGLFMSKDIFLFYFFFEIALLPVYLIANMWGGKNASKITFKMLVYTIFGSLLMLIAFILLFMRAQSSDISSLSTTVALLPNTIKMTLFVGFLIAFCIKTPVFPFHSWLPDTYSESPTPATMLLSGLLSKMGIYGILRILIPLAPQGLQVYGHIIITLALFGLIYGSIIAIQQNQLKRVLAFSSFSHMGLMAGAALTLSAAGIQGAIFQVVAHAFNAVGLFYIAKLIHEKTGSRNLSELGGIVQKAPKLAVVFMVLLLSSVALPLTSGFIGEFLMLKAIYDFHTILAIFAGLSIVFGAVYMLRYFQKIMFGNTNTVTADFTDIGSKEMLVLVPLVVITLFFGLFPQSILDLGGAIVSSLNLGK
jgi:NADH-quinone oxidoreductase subunit M